MIHQFSIIILLAIINPIISDSFKEEQLQYPRVRQAYLDKEASLKVLLAKHEIAVDKMNLYLRAFKEEKRIELWAKNDDEDTYQFIKNYEVCQTSGKMGPKRQEGDLQIPEGFYHIDRFNPYSNFYLSLGINYPNTSDRVLGAKNKLGGDIFIHGDCVTIGCLPITDTEIKELYIFCVEAKNNGQDRIPITIFPCELTETNYKDLIGTNPNELGNHGLWEDLKKGYELFNSNRSLPRIRFLNSGRHAVNP